MRKNGNVFLRILSLVMVMAMVLGMLPAGVFAADDVGQTLYLKPSSNWAEANARFAIYCFGNGDTWVGMTDADGDGVWQATVPAGYPNVIFCRMDPATTENNWNNKWNQSADLALPGDGSNLFAPNEGQWDGAVGTWSVYAPSHSVSYALTKLTTDAAGEATEGTDFQAVLTPARGYALPTAVQVTAGGREVSHTYDAATGLVTLPGSAITGEVVITAQADPIYYFKPAGNWAEGNPRYAVYAFGPEGSAWGDVQGPNADGLYSYVLRDPYTTMIFCRMNPNAPANDWNNKWNQTGDLIPPADGSNCYTVAEGTWDNGGGTWSKYGLEEETPEEPEATYIVAGSGAHLGTEWDPTNFVNKLSRSADGTYAITYANVAPGKYELKVTDGSWANSWGVEGGQNVHYEVVTACDVTVTFDPETKAITVSGSGLAGEDAPFEVGTISAVGDGSGNWLNGAAWDPTANVMAEISENVYEITYQQVPAGNYQVKFAADGSWAVNWGGVFTANGQAAAAVFNGQDNIAFTVDVPSADVTIRLDLTGYDHKTFTGATFTVSWAEHTAVEYYLVGIINGTDYSTAQETLKFVDGKLRLTVDTDSRVAVLSSSSDILYMTSGWLSNVTSAVLTQERTDAKPGQLPIPAGATYDLTLVDNGDGTLTLSYAEVPQEPARDYYLVGYIDGADQNESQEALKFADGKLRVTFTQDSYVAVKASDSDAWYMTAGWLGNVTSATLSQNPADANKLMIPGGVEYELTLVDNGDGTLTLSYAEVPQKVYYLAGYLGGADVNDNREEYKFEGGKLTITLDQTGYVILRDAEGNSYLCQSYTTGTTATLKQGWSEKLQVPGGIGLTFTVAENADGTLTLSYTTETVEVPDDARYYLVGYLNGADVADTREEYRFADGKLSVKFNQDSYVQIKTDGGVLYATESYCQADTGVFRTGCSEKMFVPGNAQLTFTLTVNDDGTLGLSYEAAMAPLTDDWYLVGYINGMDYGIGADAANLGRYKFKDGVLCTGFGADSYVAVKNGNGQMFMCETYCQSDITTLRTGWGEKMRVPGNVGVNFFLTFKEDGSLVLNYYAYTIAPPVPGDYNKVIIHFQRPGDWGEAINAWVWDANGALPGFELYQTAWPGSMIPENINHKGWFDLVIGTREPQAFNFIFNDGTKQTADLSTGKVTGPTELWVVGNNVYTSAPRAWTHATVLVHYQAPEGWGTGVTATAGGQSLDTMATPNLGWYTATAEVELGKSLQLTFSDGTATSPELELGTVTQAGEYWFRSGGNPTGQPAGWLDVNRTAHVAGTFPGNAWDAAGNKMTFDPKLGLYTFTFKDVEPGRYEYKIAINGGWDENYGADGVANGSNIPVVVSEKQDVTIWYSDLSHRSACSVSYDVNAAPELSGTGIDGKLPMTDPTLSGRFSASVELRAGNHTDLTVTFGEHTYTFAPIALGAPGKVTFWFDSTTYMATHSNGYAGVSTGKLFYDTRDALYKEPFGAVATGEDVRFAITTGTDATQVSLTVRGVGAVALQKAGKAENGVQRWEATTRFDAIGEFDYYFAVSNDYTVAYYCDDIPVNYYGTGDYGTGTVRDEKNLFPYDLVVYDAQFQTPEWMKNAVIYQIFPDRFFNGDPSNDQAQTDARGTVDYEFVSDWYALPENPEAEGQPGYPMYAYQGDGQWSNEIYGGDLKGIAQRMDYLKALGVTVIYINPVFSSISNHRYDACDYTTIDPILGTLGDFEELVKLAEENGMKVILDGVFNHVSDDSVYFDRYYKYLGKSEKVGAYPYWAYVYDYMAEKGVSLETAESAARSYFTNTHGITDFSYTEWFVINNETGAAVDHMGERSGKPVYTYEGWWGFDSMPVIKATEGSELATGTWAQEIIGNDQGTAVGQYWISQGSDGWRLDVANEVSDDTWQAFRDSVKALDSDAVIVGEIWFDATGYLLGDMYDSVMNYVFRDAVAGFARGYLINRDNKNEKWDSDYTAADAIATLELLRERYPQEAFQAMMNLVGSHDTARILSYLDGVEDDRHQKDMANAFPTYENTSTRARELQYVVSFLQFTYAGAPTVYYGDEIGMVGADDPDDRRAFTWGQGNEALVTWYATLAAIRAQYSALRTGSVDAFAPSRDVMGFVRSDEADTLVVLANRGGEATVTLELAQLGLAADAALTDLITGTVYTPENGKITVSVAACRGAILTANAKQIAVDTDALAPAFDPQYIVK